MYLQSTELDPDDPTISYMLQAGARLCKCLGEEFIPYLGVVMPPLIRSAQLKPDVNISLSDSDEEEEEDDDEVHASSCSLAHCCLCRTPCVAINPLTKSGTGQLRSIKVLQCYRSTGSAPFFSLFTSISVSHTRHHKF